MATQLVGAAQLRRARRLTGRRPYRSFCLQNLDFGPSPDASYLRATVSGDLTLRRVQEAY